MYGLFSKLFQKGKLLEKINPTLIPPPAGYGYAFC